MTDNEPEGWEPVFDKKFYLDTSGFDSPLLAVDDGKSVETFENLNEIKAFIRDNFISKAAVRKVVEESQKRGNNGENLPFENSPDIYGNQRIESYKRGYNAALSDLLRALHISEE